jgi:DNA helicase HerA-like ATPase
VQLIIIVAVIAGIVYFFAKDWDTRAYLSTSNLPIPKGYKTPSSVKLIFAIYLVLPLFVVLLNAGYFLGGILNIIGTIIFAILYYVIGIVVVGFITVRLANAEADRLKQIELGQKAEAARVKEEARIRDYETRRTAEFLAIHTALGKRYGLLIQPHLNKLPDYPDVVAAIKASKMDLSTVRNWIEQSVSATPPPNTALGTITPPLTELLRFNPMPVPVPFPLGIPREERFKHCYVIGKTGAGKTTFLRHLIQNDLRQGQGVGILVPEYELIEEQLLPFIPASRGQDVIYFNPTDRVQPVPFNPLYVTPGDDLSRAVDETLVAFRRAIGDTSPRMSAILRNTLYALMERSGSTLLDIARLLSRKSPAFRKEIIQTTKEELTAQFFEEQYSQYPADAHLPILNRLDSLVRPEPLRKMLCQSGKSIDFREAMDGRKIMLFNLSDGVLGEGNSQLLGQLIVSRFQQALMTRATVPEESRVPFFLYLDEFQFFTNTSTDAFAQLFARARRYKMGLTLAHQTTSQIPDDLLKTILGNAGTIVAFNVSSHGFCQRTAF